MSARRTDYLEIPPGQKDLVQLLSRVLTNDVEHVNFFVGGDDSQMEVTWRPGHPDEPLFVDVRSHTPNVRSLLDTLDISESRSVENYPFSGASVQRLAYELQALSARRRYAVGWACRSAEEVREWLGLDPMVSMSGLFGVPVYVEEELDAGCLFLLGSRQFGVLTSAVSDIRVVHMSREAD